MQQRPLAISFQRKIHTDDSISLFDRDYGRKGRCTPEEVVGYRINHIGMHLDFLNSKQVYIIHQMCVVHSPGPMTIN